MSSSTTSISKRLRPRVKEDTLFSACVISTRAELYYRDYYRSAVSLVKTEKKKTLTTSLIYCFPGWVQVVDLTPGGD